MLLTKIGSNLNHRNSELHAQNWLILAILESAMNLKTKNRPLNYFHIFCISLTVTNVVKATLVQTKFDNFHNSRK